MNAQSRPPMIPLIPENAPFTAEQRAWLSGFLAGALALESKPDQGLASALQLGSAEQTDSEEDDQPWHDPAMAIDERMKLAEGKPIARRLMAAMAQQDCGQCGYDCAAYSKAIADQAEGRLNLCAPGGKDTARMLKKLVEEMGGGVTQVRERERNSEPDSKDALPGYSRNNPVQARFLSRRRLNGTSSEKITNHIEIDLSPSGITYSAGDSLGVFARNDPTLVDAIIDILQAPSDFPIGSKSLRETLIENVSLGPAPDMLFQLISYLVGGERRLRAQALARGDDPDHDAKSLDVLAALQKFRGIRPDPEAFIESLEPLQPRLYSISSSPHDKKDRVSLTVDTVSYSIEGRMRLGVASTWFADRLPEGAPLKVYVQKAHGFSLPHDPNIPIIMVGPGTGIAPFRAFLQERKYQSAQGEAWLFFGHQHEESDFFYRDELESFLAQGILTRLSTAWSRDGGKKVYVQDRMRESATDLWSWLQRGAHFYICGDAKRMAKDVENTLVSIAVSKGQLDEAAGRKFLTELKKTGRYQADVY